MNRRLTAPDVMALPMTRRDISDYSALPSRRCHACFLHSQEGLFEARQANQREIIVLNPAGLAELDK